MWTRKGLRVLTNLLLDRIVASAPARLWYSLRIHRGWVTSISTTQPASRYTRYTRYTRCTMMRAYSRSLTLPRGKEENGVKIRRATSYGYTAVD